MKKRCKVLISIVIVLVAIPLFDFFILKDSVMEDIYRNVYWGNYKRINKMEGLETITSETINMDLFMSNTVSSNYKDDYLKDDVRVSLSFSPKEEANNKKIQIGSVVTLSEDISVYIGMYYDHKTHTLTYEPIFIYVENDELWPTTITEKAEINQYLEEYGITEDDIREYQHYVLYDVVYQSWISGTRNGRKLNALDYWNIKEIDNTFSFEEKNVTE